MTTKKNMHRDGLMKRNNIIKRLCIEYAAHCMSQQEETQYMDDTVHTFSTGKENKHKKQKTHKSPNLEVLDLGCGRGGDLYKFAQVGTARYVGVDISEECIAEAETRSEKIQQMQTIFFNTSVESFCNHNAQHQGQFDIICLHFVLHYIIYNRVGLHLLLTQLKKLLKKGGKIIGSVVDDEVARKYLMETSSPTDSYIKLTKRDDINDDREFGYMYEFYLHNCVDNCMEYIIPWDKFLLEVSDVELNLDYKTNFSEVDEKSMEGLHDGQIKCTKLYNIFQLS